MSQAASTPERSGGWPSPAAAWWLVALLFLAGIFSVIDRAILNVVVDPVRQDLAITEEQIGLLQGFAFGLFYAVMGLPMGVLADRTSRKRLVVLGITLWSAATIGSGFAQTFGELFAARLMVGLGEAALGPCAISLIADMFAPDRRGRPISVYVLGQGLAGGISLSVTGIILSFAMAGGFAGWPLLDGLAAWRTAFVICGVVGLLVAVGLMTTKEPARRTPRVVTPKKGGMPIAEESAFVWRNRGVMIPLYIGFSMTFLVAYGAAGWEPAMLMRSFDVSPAFLGAWLGPLTMGFALAGPVIGGQFVDWSMRRRLYSLRFAFLAILPLLGIPGLFAVFAPSPEVAAVMIASKNLVYATLGVVMLATLQAIVPPQMRGISVSLTLILNTMLGATLGPLLIASVTERVFGDEAMVGWSILTVCLPAFALSSLFFAIAWFNMKRQIRKGGETAQLLMAGEPD